MASTSPSRGGVRFQDPTLGNASPWIYVWNMWSLVASTGFIALRLWSRRAKFGLDDLLNSLAFATAVASNATVFSALGAGLGSPGGITDEGKCTSVASIVVASICLLFVTDFLSKCSTLFLARRVITHGASPDRRQQIACDTLITCCFIWVVVTLGLLGTDCIAHCSLDSHGVCATGHRALAIIVIGIFLELAIFALPVWLFANLRMALGLKITTLSLFAIRFPLIAFSIVYLVNFPRYIRSVDAGSPNIGPGVYWQQVLLAGAVIAPSLQALKKSAELFNTSGAQVHDGTTHASSSSNKASGAYRLQDLSSAGSHSRSRRVSRHVSSASRRTPGAAAGLRLTTQPRADMYAAGLSPADDARNDIGILQENLRRGEGVAWASTSGVRPGASTSVSVTASASASASVSASSSSAPPPPPGKMAIRQQTDVTVQG